MGFSKKNKSDGGSKDGKKWVIAGIALRAPLKSVSTKKLNGEGEDDGRLESGATTPTSNQVAVAECPPPPRKRRPTAGASCYNNNNNNNNNGSRNREFYTSPDIDSFFEVVLNTGRS